MSLLEWIGQDAASQIRDDLGDYDRSTGTVKRQGLEALFDPIFGRTPEKMQAEARKQYISGLEDTKAGMLLSGLRGDTSLTLAEQQKLTPTWKQNQGDLIAIGNRLGQLSQARNLAIAEGGDMDKILGLTNIGAIASAGRVAKGESEYNTPTQQRLRYKEDQADLDRRDDRRSELELRRDNMEFQQLMQGDKMDIYRTQVENDYKLRKREIAFKLGEALGALGGAFMI